MKKPADRNSPFKKYYLFRIYNVLNKIFFYIHKNSNKKTIEISIVYWQTVPTEWRSNSNISYGGIHLGFWYPNIIEEEFCSLSIAKLIVKKFYDLYKHFAGKKNTKTLNNNLLDITTDGKIKATFFKTGKLYDVNFRNPDNSEIL